MKICYDHQIFSFQKYGGVSRYIYEISSRISSLDRAHVSIVAGLYVNKYLSNSPQGIVKGIKISKKSDFANSIKLVNSAFFKFYCHHAQPDIVHETYYSRVGLCPRRSKVVVTVHDMIHEKYPLLLHISDRRSSQVKSESVKRADHIICVSQNTKADLINYLNVEQSKISVIYHGFSLQQSSNISTRPVEGSYILYVGDRIALYKNFSRLLQAYASSKLIRTNFKLVCFGSQPFTMNEYSIFSALNLSDSMVLQIAGDDSVLSSLYMNASALVYPSIYEGFGMPLIEAMSFKCPVICSNTSSIPEVASDAAEFFDPLDIESIESALVNVLFSNARTNELAERGLNHSRNFSWDKAARETLKVYDSLL